MNHFLSTLRSVSTQQMHASNRLGRGFCVPYQGAKEGRMTLSYAHSALLPAEDCLSIDTDIGTMGLENSQAEACLSLFSSVPFVLTEASIPEEKTWYVALYNQCLFSTFRNLFGSLKVSQETVPINNNVYRLAWEQDNEYSSILLRLSDEMLEHILDRLPWYLTSFLDVSELYVSTPLCLGELLLTHSDVNQLNVGDLLIPGTSFFSCQGQGSVQIANQSVQLDYIDNGTLSHYQVTHLSKATVEERSMYDEYEETDSVSPPQMQDETTPVEDESFLSPVEILADSHVSLSLQAGEVTLSLKELSQLHIGSVLTAAGEAPGQATLFKGRTPIARGDLVEVEGRLGIQLTQVLLNSYDSSKRAEA